MHNIKFNHLFRSLLRQPPLSLSLSLRAYYSGSPSYVKFLYTLVYTPLPKLTGVSNPFCCLGYVESNRLIFPLFPLNGFSILVSNLTFPLILKSHSINLSFKLSYIFTPLFWPYFFIPSKSTRTIILYTHILFYRICWHKISKFFSIS